MLTIIALVILSPAYAFAAPGTIVVDLDGTSVDVSYDADGLQVLTAVALDEGDGFASLILGVDVTGSPGILEITFDRDFFDAKLGDGNDEEFFIIADGFEELSFEETQTMSERTLRIELASGTEELEIFGTVFGTVFGEPEVMEEETMEEETMEEESEGIPEPRTQCGPGTILKNGACVLDDKCGPGTVLQDGVCVVKSSPSASSSIFSRDLIVGGGVALGIALLLIIIFAAIGRASR